MRRGQEQQALSWIWYLVILVVILIGFWAAWPLAKEKIIGPVLNGLGLFGG